jgi:small subunit ribosomal protein S2
VKSSLERLRHLEKLDEDGILVQLSKKEQTAIRREREKLMKSLGGIKQMSKLPGLMFVVDPSKEHIAIAEARKLKIPVVAITDTNCNPEQIQHVIPGNDDAIRSILLFTSRIADAALIGTRLFKERQAGRNKGDEQAQEQVIHVTSGGDGPTVEIASGNSHLTPEASASPTE